MTITRLLKIGSALISLAILLNILSANSNAEIIETTLQVPVIVSLQHRAKLSHNITVTVVRESSIKGQSPIALLVHGRPSKSDERTLMGQVKYPGNAIWLAQHGFVVVVPTRIGYGVTGGPDIDYTGECDNKDYLNGLNGGIQEHEQVLRHVSKQPYVDAAHNIIIGESFGGLLALALAVDSASIPIDGVINFAGGDGGDYSHLDRPCAPDQLEKTFAALGKNNQIKTLWLYSLNDRFWGILYPKKWFSAFRDAGGNGEFITLPADKNNGHFIFNRNGLAWHEQVEKFFKQIGVPTKISVKNTPPEGGVTNSIKRPIN